MANEIKRKGPWQFLRMVEKKVIVNKGRALSDLETYGKVQSGQDSEPCSETGKKGKILRLKRGNQVQQPGRQRYQVMGNQNG